MLGYVSYGGFMVSPNSINSEFILRIRRIIPLKFFANKIGVKTQTFYHRLYRKSKMNKLEMNAIAELINQLIRIGAIDQQELERYIKTNEKEQ